MLPILGFSGPYQFLSNMARVSVEYADITFPSVEHAYVAAKSTDPKVQRYVKHCETPKEAKRYGKTIKLRGDWEQYKLVVMRDLLIQKFTQPPYEQLLLDTGDAYLEETNHWGDKIWGVCNGVGENNLGKLLMKVRKGLQDEYGTRQTVPQ